MLSVEAMKKGAVDFLTKPVDDEQLLQAVRKAIEKDNKARADFTEVQGIRRRIDGLTPRELEVLRYVITGMLNKQIALKLDIAEKTIKVHRGRIMEKLFVDSVADLVRLAEKAGSNHPRKIDSNQLSVISQINSDRLSVISKNTPIPYTIRSGIVRLYGRA